MNWCASIAGLLVTFLISAIYSVKARWVRDRYLNWSVRFYGRDSPEYRRLERWNGNEWYLNSLRIVSGAVAVGVLLLIVYALRTGPRN
jgi:hypothetical protein